MEIDNEDLEPLHYEMTHVGGRKEENDEGLIGETTTVTENESRVLWIYHFIRDWIYTNVIGFLVVSYWRVRATKDC